MDGLWLEVGFWLDFLASFFSSFLIHWLCLAEAGTFSSAFSWVAVSFPLIVLSNGFFLSFVR